ncbi:hypothetical protein [Winogradskyella haliclonae]|uniref:Uncharacterized protein n=1 Tax=Winogradskyella haliclonae TaxID=2048558 RepID=A0ABQ2BX69_9FLAO|nr:hypothetical protein [Winogradskyella haliclonae]GGI57077.1 hypothetical protein GCM10011444_13860 [Winogradskyella haliclonae]
MTKSKERFVLVDRYLEISNNQINIIDKKGKRIKNELFSKSNGWLIVIGVVLTGNIIRKLINGFSEKIADYISIGIQGLGLLFVVYIIIYLIFRHQWQNHIEIVDITSIEVDSEDDFEHELTLITNKKREKKMSFRKLENQIEPLIEAIKKRNSRVIIKYI